ncbi:MAG: M23 family metallopeptidase [Bacillota bacterium]|jgi:murein DD-endopeptidase MepM/ murein hydrolase activator NlpD|nr:M23 family metallopeptidase [Bacillota bacterium]MDD3297841.1 M23 family metallopeptidase [Bacillota bacterium]MDD3851262.1 M23 family metallopeptidase [Bacillota bacterium]MDD4706964.1 M23 family metallopeptidase [Bacillota bacterium]
MKRGFRRSVRRFEKKDIRRRYGTGSAKDKNLLKNNLRNLTICIAVVIIILLLKKMDFFYAHKATSGIKSIITREYNLKERVVSLKDTIPVIRNSIMRVLGTGDSLGPMTMPVQGEITSGYGIRTHPVFKVESKHEGIDIAASAGEPVKAALSGVVVEAGPHPEFGNVVVIEHSTDLKTLYGHLDQIRVEESQEVSRGDTIGTIGSTGLSTGAHLHFEVWKNGRPVDPVHELDLGLTGT